MDQLRRIGRLTIACTFLLCLNGSSSAEMLLAEFAYTAPQPVTSPALYVFGVGNDGLSTDIFRNWIESLPIPSTSYADSATIAAMDRILTTNAGRNSVSFGLTNGPYEPERFGPFESFRVDAAFEGFYVDRGLTAIRHAPPIGVPYALQWYALTAIERSVTPTTQTIRVYGVAAPEPATWLMVLFGALSLVSTLRSRNPIAFMHATGHRDPKL